MAEAAGLADAQLTTPQHRRPHLLTAPPRAQPRRQQRLSLRRRATPELCPLSPPPAARPAVVPPRHPSPLLRQPDPPPLPLTRRRSPKPLPPAPLPPMPMPPSPPTLMPPCPLPPSAPVAAAAPSHRPPLPHRHQRWRRAASASPLLGVPAGRLGQRGVPVLLYHPSCLAVRSNRRGKDPVIKGLSVLLLAEWLERPHAHSFASFVPQNSWSPERTRQYN